MSRLLSPAAQRLLDLLTPEPTPLSERQAELPSVSELERLGLVIVSRSQSAGHCIRLSRTGVALRPQVRL